MAFKLGLTVECFDINQRNELLEALIEVLNEHTITDRVFTIAYEEKTMRGTKKTTEKIEFARGESIDLDEFDAILTAERPLETALRTIESVTLSSGGKSATIRPGQRLADDERVIEGGPSIRTSRIGER